MNEQLAQRIRQCPSLPSLPAIALQVLELAQRPDVDIAQIARTLSRDPALCSRILRTVNSSFYGRSQHVSTVSHALVILGLQAVKTLVLGFSLVANLAKDKSKGFNHLEYWRRSIYSATAARTIAVKIHLVQQEEAFLAALLEDIGMLVLDQVLGAEYGDIHAKAATHNDLPAIEREALGTDHAEVAGLMAAEWKLPPVLSAPIAQHHTPQAVTEPALKAVVDLVHLAGRCADVFVEPAPAPAIAEVRRLCAAQHQMSEADCDALLADIGARTREAASLFEINITGTLSYEQILKKANEALVDMTLQTQQQASTLVVQNQKLKHAATTDALTGLANRAQFDRILAEQFEAAVREGKPLSLLMLDVDQFKSINDRHGHPVGDKVLRALGQLLGTAARAQDLAARYGGEEMCLVLPNTPRATAIAVAERVRRAIAARPITCPGVQVPVTASIGVATFEPASPLRSPSHLLKAADLAVYAAKHAGRNCVRAFTINPSVQALRPSTAA
ncbi:MAG TPA: GGDEF domain-containing protein [Tepidisphaeraceae bacterium]|nr:GGDEF domain-containing protein [Tepidisphaeraceae bacterium]